LAAGARPLESTVNAAHFMGPINKDRGWIREEIIELTVNLLLDVRIVEAAAEKQCVAETESILKELQIFLSQRGIVIDFKRQSDDLQSVFPKLFLKLVQHRSFIETVVTPRPHDVHDQRLAFESVIRIPDGLAIL